MNKKFENISKENMGDVVDEVLRFVQPGCLILLDGDPGVGKTYFVSQLLWRYDISEVASPTFALHHRYQTTSVLFHHFDLYRVKSEDELDTIGLWDLINEDKNGIFLIEWSSNFSQDIWPMNAVKIKIQISICGSDSRNYQVEI